MLIAATSAQLIAVEASNGNVIKSYKSCEAQAISTSPYGIFAVQTGKPLLLQFGKKETNIKKIVLPEKVSVLRVSPCSKYLVCGAVSGRILLWSLESGQLLAAQDAHFQQVNCLAWSDDSALLVSGSNDARVLVWKTFDLLQKQIAEPQVLSGHSLAVTDVQFGKGQWREARFFTASRDGTVCVYNTRLERLTTFTVSDPIVKICIDPVERAIYAATKAGVRILPLYTISNGRLCALGGLGDIIGTDTAALLESEPTALRLSTDATLLYVGDEQGIITTWDVGTKQVLRRNKPLRGAVHSIELNEFEPKELQALQRITGESSDVVLDGARIEMDIQTNNQDILDCWGGVQISSAAAAAQPAANTRALEKENADLKKKNKELQELYDKLWQDTQ